MSGVASISFVFHFFSQVESLKEILKLGFPFQLVVFREDNKSIKLEVDPSREKEIIAMTDLLTFILTNCCCTKDQF